MSAAQVLMPRRRATPRGGAGLLLQAGYIVLFAAFMLAPLIVVIGASLEPRELLRFPPHGLSLRWYATALHSADFVGAALNSLIVATLSTVCALALGGPAAYALARYQFAGKAVVTGLLAAPLLVPQLVLGVALLQLVLMLGVDTSILTLVLGHTLIGLPYVVRNIQAPILGLDISVEEAAANLGAGRLAIYRTVILPIIRPAMYSSMLFAFLMSFDNAVISLFLVSARTMTLPVSIYNYVQFNLDPTIAAISTLLMALSIAVMVAGRKFNLSDGVNS
jgi:putative spermidine/putrescine transport system permease protein